MTEIHSKHAVVSKAPSELYMVFTDLRNLVQFLPEDKKVDVTADFDSISARVQGFNIGIKVLERTPYSKILYGDSGAPFKFSALFHFDLVQGEPYKTDFHIDLSAELSVMMKMLLGSKLKDAMDKLVDTLAAASEGRMPEGFDPKDLDEIRKKYNI